MLVSEEPLNNPDCMLEWWVIVVEPKSVSDAQPKILILIFAEVLGLYGLIVALIMNTKAQAMQVWLVELCLNENDTERSFPVWDIIWPAGQAG